ncbi:MAG: tyrosine-protein phosphatase [Nevskia sp.]
MTNDRSPEPARLLNAAPNFRDVGGLATADGRSLRHGLLYRSDALDELDADDLLRLGSLAIRVCCDLRSDGERLQRPSRWPEGGAPRTLALPVATDIRVLMPELVKQLREDPSAEGAAQLMRHLYRDLPVACAPVLARLFTLMIDEADALPLVVHCTAGKDRTGFIIAMLLHALGVPVETIAADYLQTNLRSGRGQAHAKVAKLLEALIGVAAGPDMLGEIMAARADYLDAALARLHDDYGSVDAYLLSAGGLDPARRRQLQARLLVA